MAYSPGLLDRLQAIGSAVWAGRVFRHMYANFEPDTENTRGARWNPPDVAAIYTSLSRDGVLAEAEHQLAMQPIRPRVKRTIYLVEVVLGGVADLTDRALLSELGVGSGELAKDDMVACQRIGGAAQSLGCDGLLVPSARGDFINLVIFPGKRAAGARFEVVASEPVGGA